MEDVDYITSLLYIDHARREITTAANMEYIILVFLHSLLSVSVFITSVLGSQIGNYELWVRGGG